MHDMAFFACGFGFDLALSFHHLLSFCALGSGLGNPNAPTRVRFPRTCTVVSGGAAALHLYMSTAHQRERHFFIEFAFIAHLSSPVSRGLIVARVATLRSH